MSSATLYSAGASRGNPGPAAIGFLLELEGGRTQHGGSFIGDTSNNVAEYTALVWGLENALACDVDDISVLADSELMINQIDGTYRLKNEGLRPLYTQVQLLMTRFSHFTISHIRHDQNQIAVALVGEALDSQSTVGEFQRRAPVRQSLFDMMSAPEVVSPTPVLPSKVMEELRQKERELKEQDAKRASDELEAKRQDARRAAEEQRRDARRTAAEQRAALIREQIAAAERAAGREPRSSRLSTIEASDGTVLAGPESVSETPGIVSADPEIATADPETVSADPGITSGSDTETVESGATSVGLEALPGEPEAMTADAAPESGWGFEDEALPGVESDDTPGDSQVPEEMALFSYPADEPAFTPVEEPDPTSSVDSGPASMPVDAEEVDAEYAELEEVDAKDAGLEEVDAEGTGSGDAADGVIGGKPNRRVEIDRTDAVSPFTVKEHRSVEGLTVLVGVTGCIAAYKACEIVRSLQKAGTRVKVVMTENATRFVGPTTFKALTHEPVATALFDEPGDPIHHISLAREADMMLIVPCTANVMAKIAHGVCDDLLTTTALATRAPLVIAPAMNTAMWEACATRENIETLTARGVEVIEPVRGHLACGDEGAGKLADVDEIVAGALRVLDRTHDLKGASVLITAGPTVEPIDPVRYLTNRSSGKTGYALARAALRRGADVTLVSGPVSLPAPSGARIVPVKTACEMLDACREPFMSSDLSVFTAAVCDFAVDNASDHKIKRSRDGIPTLKLTENPDIIATLAKEPHDGYVVGFAAETEDVIANAKAKLVSKSADLIVANDVSGELGFATDDNKVWFVRHSGIEELPLMRKDDIADAILDAFMDGWLTE